MKFDLKNRLFLPFPPFRLNSARLNLNSTQPNFGKSNKLTHQPHSPEDGDSVDALHGEVEEAGDDDDEVKDVPAAVKVRLAQSEKLQHRLKREEGGENLKEMI
jgi:hypothetical protein